MTTNKFFTSIEHNSYCSFFHHDNRLMMSVYNQNDQHITVYDNTGDHWLRFSLEGVCVSEYEVAMLIARNAAYSMNGSVNGVAENDHILLLGKHFGPLTVTYHDRATFDNMPSGRLIFQAE